MIPDLPALTPYSSGEKVPVVTDGIKYMATFRSILVCLDPTNTAIDYVLAVQEEAK